MKPNFKFGVNLRYSTYSSVDNGYCVYSVFGEDSNCDLGGYHHNPFLGNVEGTFKDVLEYAANNMNGFYAWGGGGYIVPVSNKNDTPIILNKSKKVKIERKSKLKNIEVNSNIIPKVGVAVIVENNGKFLLGLRKSDLGKNTWGLPGGKLDFGEELKDCAVRELLEETNLKTNTEYLKLVGISNTVFDDKTHYITVIYKTDVYFGELLVTEPDKCEKWEWFDYENLPENLFLPFKNFVLSGEKL